MIGHTRSRFGRCEEKNKHLNQASRNENYNVSDSKIKTLCGINSRLETSEQKIRELEDVITKLCKLKQRKNKD